MSYAEGSMLAALAVPFVASVAIAALGRSPRRAAAIGTGAAVASLVAVASAAPSVVSGDPPTALPLSFGPGLGISFRLDEMGLVFALLATGLWVPSSIYASGYAEAEGLERRRRFSSCFAASIGAAMGLALAGDVLTFLVFLELLSVVTYPLVAHGESREAKEAGRRYLVFSLSGGALLTAAVAWTWTLTGSLDFVPGGALASAELGDGAALALFALYIAGVGVKAAIMPLHSWLPAAMVAPTPVSALLHAVAVVKAGVFGCLRVIGFVFGPELLEQIGGAGWLAAACAITIVVGSTLAMRQESLKRRLAYSTIGHLSFIVLGAAMLSPWGMVGAIFHFANHGMAKITLFLCAGAIHAVTGASKIAELVGVGRRMPWTAAAMTVAALGLAGVPGLCGFVGKLFLYRGAISDREFACAGVLLTGSILSAAYLFPIIRSLYRPDGGDLERREARASMLGPIWGTAGLVIVFGLVPWAIDAQFQLAIRIAEQVFGELP